MAVKSSRGAPAPRQRTRPCLPRLRPAGAHSGRPRAGRRRAPSASLSCRGRPAAPGRRLLLARAHHRPDPGAPSGSGSLPRPACGRRPQQVRRPAGGRSGAPPGGRFEAGIAGDCGPGRRKETQDRRAARRGGGRGTVRGRCWRCGGAAGSRTRGGAGEQPDHARAGVRGEAGDGGAAGERGAAGGWVLRGDVEEAVECVRELEAPHYGHQAGLGFSLSLSLSRSLSERGRAGAAATDSARPGRDGLAGRAGLGGSSGRRWPPAWRRRAARPASRLAGEAASKPCRLRGCKAARSAPC